jgi:hypothetical protein
VINGFPVRGYLVRETLRSEKVASFVVRAGSYLAVFVWEAREDRGPLVISTGA